MITFKLVFKCIFFSFHKKKIVGFELTLNIKVILYKVRPTKNN